MNIISFLDQPLFNIPKSNSSNRDFKDFLFAEFDEFLKKLKNLADNDENFNYIEFPIHFIYERQQYLIGKLKKVVDSYYNGKPNEAYNELETGLISDLKEFTKVLNKRSFCEGHCFFRIRYSNSNYPYTKYEMFHKPYELRTKVSSQRFSIPGFPSLYLGTSIYVCWEELKRPNVNEFLVSKLEIQEDINVFDLSPPKSEDNPRKFYNYLMVWPIALACSIKVKYPDDSFKPEYIVPQLLLQWVRMNNSDVDGIAYQTTHIDFNNKQFKGEFMNIVLPVKENKTKGLCNVLANKFKMTEATSVQLSQISSGGNASMYSFEGENTGLNKVIQKVELANGRIHKYSDTIFGSLERELGWMDLKEII
jgi:hypothetical protein